jgi:hypothetical protein
MQVSASHRLMMIPHSRKQLWSGRSVGIPYRNSGFNIERLARLLDRLKFSTSTHCLLSVTYESCLPLFPEFPHAGVDCALNGNPIGPTKSGRKTEDHRTMKKCLLAALVGMALAASANAQTTTLRVSTSPAPTATTSNVRPYATVPDAGSTVTLLGLSFGLLELARRKFGRGI